MTRYDIVPSALGLLGCARERDSGFLDFAIALEAALLAGQEVELSYKVSLYGALFLRDVHDPHETFGRLSNIYAVRSKLVHGEPVKAHRRTRAYEDAPLIATAVMRRAVEFGWPDTKSLDEIALRSVLAPAGLSTAKLRSPQVTSCNPRQRTAMWPPRAS